MSSKRSGNRHPFVARELSNETLKFRNLRELSTLKVANRCIQEEIEHVRAKAEQVQSEVLKLFMEAERFRTDCRALQDKIRSAKTAVREKREPAVHLKTAA